ncbi:hypothetical protein AB0O01_25965 [Streptomyces sp. NPDC093252]|uniref:hypothetical protein n=1 Tax=Streptomyces sp. NPDC093252 TaxID=3154980 RepID=UPI00343CE38B
MRKRLVKRMFREMAEGRPVRLTVRFAGLRTMARLACLAEQFGYRYADASQGREEMYLMLRPDPGAEGRARAAGNRARYPDAATGGPRPPLAPEDVALFRLRIEWDLRTELSGRVRLLLVALFFIPVTAAFMYRFRGNPTAVVVAGVFCGVILSAAVVFERFVNPRSRARHVTRMLAAGLTPVTDERGRLRYVPSDGPQFPAPGNPFAVGH